jgi:hypothetical protein
VFVKLEYPLDSCLTVEDPTRETIQFLPYGALTLSSDPVRHFHMDV